MTRAALVLIVLVALPAHGGEQVIHERPKAGGESEAVVTLMDPDRTDPWEYRWVLINARFHDYSLMVNRENGSVYQCVGKIRPWAGDDPGKQCARVYEGPVVAR